MIECDNLGDRIIFLRKGKGLTRQELAAKTGLTSSALSCFEQNMRQPNLVELECIADALDTSAGELVRGTSLIASKNDMLYCTRLLLKHWPTLKEHYASINASYPELLRKADENEIQALISNMFIDPNSFVECLKRSRGRTFLILSHIDSAIRKWERTCGKSYGGRIRRRIIREHYFDLPRKSIPQIAVDENKPRGVIGKYLNSAVRDLSGLIFGTDGLLKTRGVAYSYMPRDNYPLHPAVMSPPSGGSSRDSLHPLTDLMQS